MTRRALRPRVSDGGGSGARETDGGGTSLGTVRPDHGAHLLSAFPALVGGARRHMLSKKGRRPRRAILQELFRILRLACSRARKNPCRAGQKRAPKRRGSTSFQAERSIHLSSGAVNSLTQYIAFVFLYQSNRMDNLRFYFKLSLAARAPRKPPLSAPRINPLPFPK